MTFVSDIIEKHGFYFSKEEDKIRQDYFSSKKKLWNYLYSKFSKYLNKPVILKKEYGFGGIKVGIYKGFELPSVFIDGRIHRIAIEGTDYMFFDDDFEVYKKKFVDGKKVHHWIDVKCPHCGHVGLEEMQFLIWKLNCSKCRGTITVDDRVEKLRYNRHDYR